MENEDAFFDVLDRIDEAMAAGDFDEADEEVRRARSEFGDEPELLVSDAEVSFESGNYEACIDKVESYVDDVPEGFRADLLVLKADSLFYTDAESTARKTYNRAVECEVTWGALLGRAEVHQFLDYPRAAMLDLDRAIHLDDQEPEPFVLRGDVQLRLGEVDEAADDYAHAVDLDPGDEEARLQLARVRASQGDESRAIELLESVVDEGQDPDVFLPGALLRSQMSLTLGSTREAVEDAELAIEEASELPWGYLQKAACHLHASRPGDAIAVLEEAEDQVDDAAQVPDLNSLRASAYDQLGKPEKAAEYRQRLTGAPQLPQFVYGAHLNPAEHASANPNRPIDTETVLEEVFGDADRAPPGYREKVSDLLDRVAQAQLENPQAGEIEIELPPVQEGGESPGQLVLDLTGR